MNGFSLAWMLDGQQIVQQTKENHWLPSTSVKILIINLIFSSDTSCSFAAFNLCVYFFWSPTTWPVLLAKCFPQQCFLLISGYYWGSERFSQWFRLLCYQEAAPIRAQPRSLRSPNRTAGWWIPSSATVSCEHNCPSSAKAMSCCYSWASVMGYVHLAIIPKSHELRQWCPLAGRQ